MARIELLADAAVMVLLMGWMSPPVGAQVVACASSSECAVGQTCYGTACAAARRRQLSRSSNARKRKSTFDIGTITVTLKEQWWISFEMRVNTNFVAGHNNMVNTAAGRYPGLYDNSDARGFCCSHEPGAPSISDQPNWGAAAGTDFLIEAKRTLQSDGTYLNQRIVDGVVLAEASGGAHGQTATTTFYMNYDYERPNAYVRNVDVWYYD